MLTPCSRVSYEDGITLEESYVVQIRVVVCAHVNLLSTGGQDTGVGEGKRTLYSSRRSIHYPVN